MLQVWRKDGQLFDVAENRARNLANESLKYGCHDCSLAGGVVRLLTDKGAPPTNSWYFSFQTQLPHNSATAELLMARLGQFI